MSHIPTRWTLVVLNTNTLEATCHGMYKELAIAESRALQWNRALSNTGRRHLRVRPVLLQKASAEVRDAAWPVVFR